MQLFSQMDIYIDGLVALSKNKNKVEFVIEFDKKIEKIVEEKIKWALDSYHNIKEMKPKYDESLKLQNCIKQLSNEISEEFFKYKQKHKHEIANLIKQIEGKVIEFNKVRSEANLTFIEWKSYAIRYSEIYENFVKDFLAKLEEEEIQSLLKENNEMNEYLMTLKKIFLQINDDINNQLNNIGIEEIEFDEQRISSLVNNEKLEIIKNLVSMSEDEKNQTMDQLRNETRRQIQVREEENEEDSEDEKIEELQKKIKEMTLEIQKEIKIIEKNKKELKELKKSTQKNQENLEAEKEERIKKPFFIKFPYNNIIWFCYLQFVSDYLININLFYTK